MRSRDQDSLSQLKLGDPCRWITYVGGWSSKAEIELAGNNNKQNLVDNNEIIFNSDSELCVLGQWLQGSYRSSALQPLTIVH